MFRVLSLPAAALAAVALWAGPASAQYRSPDQKGFTLQQSMLAQQQQAARYDSRPAAFATATRPATPPAQSDVLISIATPARSPSTVPATVTVRGPDGDVRTFPVEGGQAALQTRVIVLRPGERVTVQLRPAAPARP